jgi:flavin-binding protein dodecin
MPFAPGVAALRESIGVIKDLIDDCGSKIEDNAFAVAVAEELIGLVASAPQAADGSLDNAAAAAAVVSHNLKWLAKVCFPEHPISFADVDSYILKLQVLSSFCAHVFVMSCLSAIV